MRIHCYLRRILYNNILIDFNSSYVVDRLPFDLFALDPNQQTGGVMLRGTASVVAVSVVLLCLLLGTAVAAVAQQNAIAPDPSAGIQYVAVKCGGGVACTDVNSGLSWGSAKASPAAAIGALPSTGGTVYVAQGTYTGPSGSTFKNNVRLECPEYQAPSVVMHATNSFWLSVSDQKCVFNYTGTLVLDSLESMYIKGIAFNCPSGGSLNCLQLKGVTNSKFVDDSFYAGTGTAAASGILIQGPERLRFIRHQVIHLKTFSLQDMHMVSPCGALRTNRTS
jgi:hypothetical protein